MCCVLPTGENIIFSEPVYLYIHPMTGVIYYLRVQSQYNSPSATRCRFNCSFNGQKTGARVLHTCEGSGST